MEASVGQGIAGRLKRRAYRLFGVDADYGSDWLPMMEKQVKEYRKRLDNELQVLEELLRDLSTLSEETRKKREEEICQSTREIRLVGRCLAFYTSRSQYGRGGKLIGTWDAALGDKVLKLLSRAQEETKTNPCKKNCGIRYQIMRRNVPLWCSQFEEDAPEDDLAIAE